ncbi:hypothetical protein JQ557_20655 [Bradyrhizobium sp. U87765 SZCCT0131]|uniref:FG-GAP-like repeat-containing protein n=1 Tax=unclassified Bradyrhizobium TaxID=2631580 RepID=UPI001BA4D555|nr:MULTISPECIES: FG-GAP-like repeat-containing protein [unclassified Bradyrhizobium]MBR1220424.1 hypothetical protein [Bradyrhizobium sp. U87765 SZCCT0131]MBR1263121.1 hypothetical protein [Bradyrhizobium sp. U87765 SZCCT0134]MBR1306996.1 hypothetical protein [Bradyrhizobium sp. U87765 SZCCT0110]MBR1323116.1 hypothetical protein [Bradyrhizobium sp. U87765 SZCCT0109]MBR1345950.1 hypothetical protein [Bradyrhizobium sp. U87765 SZCCT0048]
MAGLYPLNIMLFNGKIIYNGLDSSNRRSLWVTNGTAAGTYEIGGLGGVGVSGSYTYGLGPLNLSVVGSSAYFLGQDTNGNYGLWVTDGTTAGTTEIGGLGNHSVVGAPSSGGLSPFNIAPWNGKFAFSGYDSSVAQGLWISDGTAAGTIEVGGIGNAGVTNAASSGLNPSDITSFNGKFLFNGYDTVPALPGVGIRGNPIPSRGLWISDGTAAGTIEIGGRGNAGVGVSWALDPSDMTVFNGKVLFSSGIHSTNSPSPANVTLWVTDGTAAGTTVIGGTNNAGITGVYSGGLNPSYMTVLNTTVLLNGYDSNGYDGLWTTDGTATGTVEVGGLKNAGIAGVSSSSLNPTNLVAFNGKVLFNGTDAAGHRGLWVSDGTAAGTYEIGGLSDQGVLNASPYGLNPSGLTVFNGQVVFSGAETNGVSSLWITDGTAGGTHKWIRGVGNDFVGNGISDVFWQNTTSSTIGEWLMDPSGSGQIATAPSLGNAPDYSIVGTGDFNGDGTADVLTLSNGTLGAWLMTNGQISSAPSLTTVPSDVKIVAIGNFAGGGIDSIFWQNSSTGQIGEWLMNPNGSGQIASAPVLGVQPASLQIIGAGDFNGDGTDDIFWRQSDGTVGEWLMGAGQISSGITLGGTPAGLQILGFGDFTGNGTDDVVWRSGNTVGEWLMQNGQISQSITLGDVASTWQFVGTGKFTGSAIDGMLWRDSASGALSEWQMSGAQISQAVGLGSAASNLNLFTHK